MKEHPQFKIIDTFEIKGITYVRSDKPIKEGDVVIDKRDLCWANADLVTDAYVGMRNSMGCEGVPKEFVQRLEEKIV